jgi:hypothetical protein
VSRITFPGTPSYNASYPNTLYDYEEGTWTPTLNSGFGVVSYGTQSGRYIKIGSTMYFTLYIYWYGANALGTYTAGISLPFSGPNEGFGASIGYISGFPDNLAPSYTTPVKSIQARVLPYFSQIRLYCNPDGIELYANNYAGQGGLEITGTYIING